jgi:aminopeptidase-like protein
VTIDSVQAVMEKIVLAEAGEEMGEFISRVYPICRSITAMNSETLVLFGYILSNYEFND